MFSRRCPSCKQKIFFNWIRKNVNKDYFNCPHCHCLLAPKFSNVLINSIILGAGTGAILAKLTNISLEFIIIICSFSGMFLQKYVDIFFSLEKIDE